MKTSDFNYTLPPQNIAQQPLRQRDACRMAVLSKNNAALSHHWFIDLPDFLHAGDCLVLNNSKVLPCRLPCVKKNSGGAVELFLLRPDQLHQTSLSALARPSKKLKIGTQLLPAKKPKLGSFIIEEIRGEGRVSIRWEGENLSPALLEEFGMTPLPPYITRDRLPDAKISREDKEFYQTIYARYPGSSAAPTAGLHFTENILTKVRKNLIGVHEITHHVGAGTFLPVKTANIEDHPMHEEHFEISKTVSNALNQAKNEGRRIIAVGTTTLRALESSYLKGSFHSGKNSTQLFIRPGYDFCCVDGLITNFHQPGSTLLALVSALAGKKAILNAYNDCISRRYRFLSYGDCMFIS